MKVKPTSSRLENMIMAEVYQTKFLMLFFLGHFARIIKFPPEYRIHSIMNKTREMTQTKCTRWLILMCILNVYRGQVSLSLFGPPEEIHCIAARPRSAQKHFIFIDHDG